MDSFENQIISAIKKIRNANRRPDAEKIFKTITKDSASNVTLDDIQQNYMRCSQVPSWEIHHIKVWILIT